MNYNALLLLDKHHKHKVNLSVNAPNINQLSFFQKKNSHNINVSCKDIQKYKKCFSVKPSIYMMPKDVIIKEIFEKAIKSLNFFKNEYGINDNNNINNDSNKDRKYIFDKIKKFILINHLNYNVFGKTIFLYDLLFAQKEREGKGKKFSKFYDLDNLSIALISFILIMKFNNEENKIISLKKFIKNFEEGEEKIIFEDICEMEIIALQLINYNLTFQTPYSFLELFLINGIIFNEDSIHSDLSFDIYNLVNETIEKIMKTSNEYFKYNYFYLCCSVIMHVRENFKINKWPKALEISFDVKYEEFCETYNIFFSKNNKIKNNNCVLKNNIKSFYNADIINISNLKSMSIIISVLKIMKSADKYRKAKDQINKLDLFNKNEEKEENPNNINSNNNININSKNRIKVGLKKNWNLDSLKSPEKFTMNKNSKSSILDKINQENKNLFSNLYNKNIENIKNINENENTNNIVNNISKNEEQKNEDVENKEKNSDKFIKKDNFTNIENNKIFITKSCNRYKKNINILNKYNRENIKFNNANKNNKNSEIHNNSNIDNYFENHTLNINIYKKRNYLNKRINNLLKDNQNEIKTNNLNYSNINSYNLSTKNSSLKSKISNRYYSNFTEKKRNFMINNHFKKTNFNLNQTSFNDYLYSKNKKNKINEINNESNYLDNFKSKNKEENSNAPTCESSNLKISLNDFSIRKSYRLKKNLTKQEDKNEEKLDLSPKKERDKRFEKESPKIFEKNKSYNKIINNKKSFSENTYNRKTGVRKFYKQKNLLENH